MTTPLVIGKAVSSSERSQYNNTRNLGAFLRIVQQTDPQGISIRRTALASDVADIAVSNTTLTLLELNIIARFPPDPTLYPDGAGAIDPNATVPTAPTFIGGRSGDTTATLTIQAPQSDGGAPITDYLFFYTPDNLTLSSGELGSAQLSLTVTGLINGIYYTFYLKAVNGVGAGPSSGPFTLMATGPPPAPLISSAVRGNTSATINFTTASNGGGSILNYLYSIDGGITFTKMAPPTTISPLTITGLTNGTQYSFCIQAVSNLGISPTSNISNIIVPASPNVPLPPVINSHTATTSSVTLNFTPGASSNPITNYLYSIDGGSTFTAFSPATGVVTSVLISGLTRGAEYTMVLKAFDSNSLTSGPSIPYVVKAAVVPSAPSITNNSDGPEYGSIYIFFDPPADDGGSPITNYGWANVDGPGGAVITPIQTTSPLVISGLATGETYYLGLYAINDIGAGANSPEYVTVFIPEPGAPDPPVITSHTATSTSITLAFTQGYTGTSAITNYLYSANGGFTFTSAGRTTSPITITGLTLGEYYGFTMKAVNSTATSIASASYSGNVFPCLAPDTAPLFLNATAGDGFAVIGFQPQRVNRFPNTRTSFNNFVNNVGLITNYQYSTNGSSWTTLNPPQAAMGYLENTATDVVTKLDNAIKISGLNNGQTYTFYIRAVNPAGVGPASASITVTPYTRATAPTITSVTAGVRSITVNFTAPASNGGSAITNYFYSINSNTENAWETVVLDPLKTTSPIIITGLTSGLTYLVSIGAVTSYSWGTMSAYSSGTPT
jgi:large repetitive protein